MSEKELNEKIEEVKEDEVVEAYQKSCANTTKRRCLTDCIGCTPLFTCDR